MLFMLVLMLSTTSLFVVGDNPNLNYMMFYDFDHNLLNGIAGIFASDPAHCSAMNKSCPLEQQAKQIVLKLDGFFQLHKFLSFFF